MALTNAYGSDSMTGAGTTGTAGMISSAATAGTSTTGATGIATHADVVTLQHSVIAPYRSSNPCWLTSDANLAKLRRITDTTGRPLWEPSLQVGAPDTLMGARVVTDPNVAAFGTASGTKGIAWGSFERYYALRSAGLRIETSRDYKFANDLVATRIIHRLDGKVIGANAVKVLVSATS